MPTSVQFVYTITPAPGYSAGLWAATGTSPGPQDTLIKAVTAGGAFFGLGFLPGYSMARLPNGKVVFGATANVGSSNFDALTSGIELWVTDGTAVGTVQI